MRYLQTRPSRFFIASLALVAAGGCGDSTSPGEPEDPGVSILPAAYYSGSLVWTRDGTGLVYVVRTTVNATEAALLRVLSISEGTVRQLDVFPPIGGLVRSPAGERVYFGNSISPPSGSTDNYQISRVHPTSGFLEIVTTTRAGDFAVSSDERFLAVGRYLYDLQTGARITLATGIPIDFSPDGTQLLYYPFSSSSPTLIATADGTSRPLHSTGLHIAHRWQGNSPQLLEVDDNFEGTVHVSEIDGVTGATISLGQIPGHSFFPAANWSPDGRVLAIWVTLGPLDGPTREYLYLIRDGNAPAILANTSGAPGRPIFSPDGHSVAYFNYRQETDQWGLYLKSGI